ncbi:DNA polymerase III subunit alpha [Selenomonas caprae]|uniref:DNA polymerase III subunit alpha n=1 Tax=Selenomonas caprae TaxID=2606905 RepID=UPI0021071604|nr:DNA polymerase III subunit alpha [Selenomonas caprae]
MVSKIPFCHLHTHTEFSLLDGASRIKELVSATKELGMASLAITDHGVMFGVIDFYKECKKQGIKPIVGCEVYLAPGDRKDRQEVNGVKYYHLILLAENQTGYKNLVQLVSLANIEGMYYKPRIDKELLRKYHEGIICLSACIAGEIPRALIQDNKDKADALVQEYLEIFGKDNFFLEIQNHGLPEERKANAGLIELAEKYDIGLVATNDCHYVKREDSEFHDVLLCIQMGKTIDDPDRMRFNSDDYYVKSPTEMAALFPEHPEALANTAKIAARCQVDFEFGNIQLPYYPIPAPYADDEAYLRALCEEALPSRYPDVTSAVRERLDYELDIIHRMGYDSYFLIVWDFINHSREVGISVGPGRGSAAGSIVAYLLGITNLDPLKYDLLFERFLNPDRVTMPDIDIDFCYIRREEVIDYVKERYGYDHVAQIVTFGTMAAKGAVRDVGRVLNMPYAQVADIAKLIPNELKMTLDKALKESKDLHVLYEANPEVKRLIDLARKVEGLPRHSSTHAAGVVIARNPLTDYLPVTVSDGTLVTEFDKDHVEELGLLKMDFLGLRTLTVISDTLQNIEQTRGEKVDINKIPLEDELTARMLCEGRTGAVFQMESSGMTQLVKDLAPKNFADLIPTVALYRPGPLGSGMVEDFISGRHGRKEVTYMHPLLEPILKETFGVVLYQEQVMQIVQVLAGFSLGQADLLRRAMGKKKHEILMAQKTNFLSGCAKNHIEPGLANTIFDLLTHFADYGFNKSHSAAYALVAWQTAYLKAHYPAEFMAAMLTSIMDTQKVPTYIELCKRMGIKILPPDINASSANFSVDGEAIRFGLAAVRNVGDAAIQDITAARSRDGAFKSLVDFCSRVDMGKVNKRVVESLIKCGAFDSSGAKRSQLVAVLDAAVGEAQRQQKDAQNGQLGLFTEETMGDAGELQLPDIEEAPEAERLEWEKETTGFYITGHPLDQFRRKLENLPGIATLEKGAVKDKQLVRIGGLLTETKRITTKKGDTMCFATLEDYTERMEITVFPRTFYEHANLLVPDMAVVIQGKTDIGDDGVKILADKVWSLREYLPEYYLRLPEGEDTAGLRAKLKDIMAAHPGQQAVFLQSGGRWQKLGEAFWLDDSDEVLTELTGLLGPQAVKKR